MEVKVDPEIVENIQKVVKEENIKEELMEEVKVDPEIMEHMERDLLQMEVVINNMTSTFKVGADLSLDLEGLVMRGINMEYKGGTSLIYKIRQPQSSATIFSSGKVNMVGSKSEEEARAASRKVGRSLQKLIVRYPGEICPKKRNVSEEIRVRDFQVRGVWASTQLPWDIRIQDFLQKNHRNKACQFNPESRQNIFFKIAHPKATVKIHSSGKLVIQAAAVSNVHSAIRQIYPRLFPHKKKRREVKRRDTETPLGKGDKMWRKK